ADAGHAGGPHGVRERRRGPGRTARDLRTGADRADHRRVALARTAGGSRAPLPGPMKRRAAYWLAGTTLPRHLPSLRGRMPAVTEIDGMGTERARCGLAANPSPM